VSRDALAVRKCAVLGAAFAICLAGCSGDGAAPAARPGGGAVPVVVAAVEKRPWVDRIQALGTTRANESVTLTAKVTETVDRVNFKDGDSIEAGAILVELTGRAELAALREAQATYTEATRQYERNVELSKQRTISESVLDTQLAARDSARARMDAIRARLGDRVITAPFAGVLGFRRVSPGTLVTPGTEITTLDDISVVKLDFSIPERHLALLAAGQGIQAESVAFPERKFEGTVTSIDSRVDPVTRAITVRAEIPNPERLLKPGMLMTVDLFDRPRDALVLPELALSAVGDRQFVFRVEADDTAKQVTVKVGARHTGEVEILEGLAEGDRIVTDGLVRMRDGIRVTLPEAAASAPIDAEKQSAGG
jgi:membrane fusion protein (multidrug efflux system)